MSHDQSFSMAAEAVEDIPAELQDRLTEFDDALSKIEEVLEPLHHVPLGELHAKISTLDKAKIDLTGAYAINSLFWMYLNVRGENPKLHGVKQELDRIRQKMSQVTQIQDKEKAPKLNKDASKRFVRNALWQMAQKPKADTSLSEPSTCAGPDVEESEEWPKPGKRPLDTDSPDSPQVPKKQKKKKKKKGK